MVAKCERKVNKSIRSIAVNRAQTKRERPDSINGQWLPTSILQQSVKFSGSQVISGDIATGLRISTTHELRD